MTTPHTFDVSGPPAGCPHRSDRAVSAAVWPLPIHGPAFSADPRATYARLRETGPIAPVEIAPGVHGYLAVTYDAALHLLRNTPGKFAKDPAQHWRALRDGQIPPDSPALMMMQPRDNALWKDGVEHARLRGAITGSLARVDTHALAATVARIADTLIDRIAAQGHGDLMTDYADPLPMQTLISLFGCPPELGMRIVRAIAALFDTAADAAAINAELGAACLELADLKRRRPGADVTSWLLAHPAALTDAEMAQQIILVIGAGTTPTTNLIANATLLMISDEEFSGDVFSGVRPVPDAMDHVLWTDSPVATYCPLYAREPETYRGVRLEPGVPILVSFAAANTDPALGIGPRQWSGNRAHLAFSTGVRGCPAPNLARVIAETAVEHLLDRLPGLDLAVPADQLTRRPGTFHSGWAALPVTFPPVAPSTAPAPGGTS
ncbi:cytochrome P450 [Streptomyces sp. HK10]|uniref:cytochrome P450 n=1 Tax=Streptomyces sp. HK10 TaxID=3373255 RepID=UPI0037483C25